MIKTDINLIPDIVNPTPDYYCTWQTQLYATNDGKPVLQRAEIGEKQLFLKEKPYGWAYFYQKVRNDLIIVMDDSWDVPAGVENESKYYGCLVLDKGKFPKSYESEFPLKALSDKIKSLGWKGLGCWICIQDKREEFWKEKLVEANEAGIALWKVDWGKKGYDGEYRRKLTGLAKKYAPDLTVEHAMIQEIISASDIFRTYDVPAVMSIPMTVEKIAGLKDAGKTGKGCNGIINCEDELYIAAALGMSMGIMRHPFAGDFMNGKPDMSFPALHRNIKSKMQEVVRAVRWHKVAPAFGVNNDFNVSGNTLCDTWSIENADAEIESWWFENPLIKDFYKDGVISKTAPASISRGTALPKIIPDKNGDIPFAVSSLNPNGVYSVATLGRTRDREYFIPRCRVEINIAQADTIGVFGEYESLVLYRNGDNIIRILAQDMADDNAYDITSLVKIEEGKITVDGSLIERIGTLTNPENDTSEPGLIIKIQ